MAKTEVDDYLESKFEKRAERDEHDIALWQTWKANKTPQTLQPLLKRFEPTLNAKVRDWKAPNVNETAFRSVLQSHAIKAFENYNPDRGASLNTHVTTRIEGAKRFNTRSQNVAYIPEDKVKYIGKIDAARDQLYDELGREPTHAEIAPFVGIPAKRVKEIQGLRRADLRASAFQSDPSGYVGSRDQEVISLLRPELKEEDHPVFDHLYGMNGLPVITSTGALAKKLGKSPSQISRIKNRIAAAYKKYV